MLRDLLQDHAARRSAQQQQITSPMPRHQACSHASLRPFARDDPTWSADELIRRVGRMRSEQRVPFYLYDADMLDGINITRELRKVEACRIVHKSGDDYQYTIAQYYFMRSVATHPWRVRSADQADVIVIPGIPDMKHRCPALVSHEEIAAAVQKSAIWQARPRDHLYVSSEWRRFRWAINSSVITRAFIQSRTPFELLLHDAPPKANTLNHDLLIAHPYVDNGPRNSSAATDSQPAKRDVDFFFGGQTSTRIGPGRRHLGYYSRWQLMGQWSGAPRAFPKTLLIETDEMLNQSRMGAMYWPAVRRCGYVQLERSVIVAKGYDKMVHPSWYAADDDATWSCVPECHRRLRSGACHGRYTVEEELTRARFALCLRGDIPTSPRVYGVHSLLTASLCCLRASPGIIRFTGSFFGLYPTFFPCAVTDAIRFGAIPVLVSDNLWNVGMPFQCWVPHDMFMVTLNETQLAQDAAGTLLRLASTLSPEIEQRMRKLIDHFRRDLLWKDPDSRVAENVLIEAQRWRAGSSGSTGPESGASSLSPDCCPFGDRTVH